MAKICTAMPFLATRVKRGSTRMVFEPSIIRHNNWALPQRSFRRKLLVRDTRSPFPKYGRCVSFDTSFTLIRSTPYFGYTFIKIILNDFYFTLPAGGPVKKDTSRCPFYFIIQFSTSAFGWDFARFSLISLIICGKETRVKSTHTIRKATASLAQMLEGNTLARESPGVPAARYI